MSCWVNDQMNNTFDKHGCVQAYASELPVFWLGACIAVVLLAPFWVPALLAKIKGAR